MIGLVLLGTTTSPLTSPAWTLWETSRLRWHDSMGQCFNRTWVPLAKHDSVLNVSTIVNNYSRAISMAANNKGKAARSVHNFSIIS